MKVSGPIEAPLADSGENERGFREENDRPFRAKTITAGRLPKLGAFMIRENLSATKPVQRKEAVGRLELHRLASSYFPSFSFEGRADSPVSSMDFGILAIRLRIDSPFRLIL